MQTELKALQHHILQGDYQALEVLFKLMAEHRQDMLKPYIKPLNEFVRRESLKFIQRRDEDSVDLWRIDELRFKSYALGAVCGCFDSYMIAMEWQREPRKRFWLPRRNVLEGQHGIITLLQDYIDNPHGRKYLQLTIPPGTGKTVIILFLSSFILGLEPLEANIYTSYAGGRVDDSYNGVKDMITSDEYCHKLIFPNENKPRFSAEGRTISYRNPGDSASITFASIGGSVRGRTRATRFLLVDDIVSGEEEARSVTRMENLWKDFVNDVEERIQGDEARAIMIGNILSPLEPAVKLRKLYEGDSRYHFENIPVEDEDGESNFEYENGLGYSKERIADIKKIRDPEEFQTRFMGNPIPKGGLIYPSNELKYYNGILPDGEPDIILFFCDVAWGNGDALSKPVGYVYGENVYIHGVVFNKSDKYVTRSLVVESIIYHKAQRGIFEAETGGHEYADIVSEQLKGRHSCDITYKSVGSKAKYGRIVQYRPDVKRNFWFLGSSELGCEKAVCAPKYGTEEAKRLEALRTEDDLPIGYLTPEYIAFMKQLTTLTESRYNSRNAAKHAEDDAADSIGGLAAMVMERVDATPSVTYVGRQYY